LEAIWEEVYDGKNYQGTGMKLNPSGLFQCFGTAFTVG